MENAVDALHIAFAVLVFAIALGMSFTAFSQAKQVADIVLYLNDRTNFQEDVEMSTNEIRTVGIETIIPEIRNYIHDNEGYSVEVIADGQNYIFDIPTQNEAGIITDAQLQEYCEEKMKIIINNHMGDKFQEIYSEYPYSGGYYEVGGTKTDVETNKGKYTAGDGEVVEAVNTQTKVKITYRKV